jgi:TolA-binding protein
VESLLPALLEAAPQLAAAVLLLLILGVVLKASAQDRADYREQLKAAATLHAEEVKRINSDHDAELAELRSDIKELREKVDDLQSELDLEREARRKAEDLAAEALRNWKVR